MMQPEFSILPRFSAKPSRAALIAAVLLIAGCVAFQPPVQEANGPQRAEAAARKGDHAQAAGLYESAAAATEAANRPPLALAAVREWLAAGRAADATRVLGTLGANLSPEQAFERRLLDAEVALVAGRPQDAWQQVSAIAEPTTTQAARRYLELRMRVAFAAALPVDAIRAEMAAERFAPSAAERTRLRTDLLAQLKLARGRGVKLEPQGTPDPTVRGWLDLGASAATEARGVALTAGADAARWRARYPNHPATEVLAEAFPLPLPSANSVGRVALLLPLTGAAAAAAATVRDGFMSAYYQLPEGARPDIHVYDTTVTPVAEALAQARSAGSVFIVGPLMRSDVAAAADQGSQSIPVLALNFLPGDRAGPTGFYQFALSPEDEARAIARRLVADGRRRGVALVPNGDWGNRVLAAFNRELLAAGGSLLATTFYDTTGNDYGTQIKTALRLSDSETRMQRLQTVLGTKLSFEPRRRADVDFIFAPAPAATTARLLEPQLRFYYAGDLPTYSTSDAYEPDSIDSNQDLNGLIYPDMPWMVADDATLQGLRANAEEVWGTRVAWRSRLFAFGYDACQLVVALQNSKRGSGEISIAGLTGQLSFDADRRVHRDLIWAQIKNGEPRLLGAAAGAAAGAGP
jgi:outer membrane PBP1 activator LpoA protein